ncbi:MAG: hypothetical protein MHM6MM_000327 [Cercozoa sp. M6MM]
MFGAETRTSRSPDWLNFDCVELPEDARSLCDFDGTQSHVAVPRINTTMLNATFNGSFPGELVDLPPDVVLAGRAALFKGYVPTFSSLLNTKVLTPSCFSAALDEFCSFLFPRCVKVAGESPLPAGAYIDATEQTTVPDVGEPDVEYTEQPFCFASCEYLFSPQGNCPALGPILGANTGTPPRCDTMNRHVGLAPWATEEYHLAQEHYLFAMSYPENPVDFDGNPVNMTDQYCRRHVLPDGEVLPSAGNPKCEERFPEVAARAANKTLIEIDFRNVGSHLSLTKPHLIKNAPAVSVPCRSFRSDLEELVLGSLFCAPRYEPSLGKNQRVDDMRCEITCPVPVYTEGDTETLERLTYAVGGIGIPCGIGILLSILLQPQRRRWPSRIAAHFAVAMLAWSLAHLLSPSPCTDGEITTGGNDAMCGVQTWLLVFGSVSMAVTWAAFATSLAIMMTDSAHWFTSAATGSRNKKMLQTVAWLVALVCATVPVAQGKSRMNPGNTMCTIDTSEGVGSAVGWLVVPQLVSLGATAVASVVAVVTVCRHARSTLMQTSHAGSSASPEPSVSASYASSAGQTLNHVDGSATLGDSSVVTGEDEAGATSVTNAGSNNKTDATVVSQQARAERKRRARAARRPVITMLRFAFFVPVYLAMVSLTTSVELTRMNAQESLEESLVAADPCIREIYKCYDTSDQSCYQGQYNYIKSYISHQVDADPAGMCGLPASGASEQELADCTMRLEIAAVEACVHKEAEEEFDFAGEVAQRVMGLIVALFALTIFTAPVRLLAKCVGQLRVTTRTSTTSSDKHKPDTHITDTRAASSSHTWTQSTQSTNTGEETLVEPVRAAATIELH